MSEEALDTLRKLFSDADESAIELREAARETALELAGRSTERPVDDDED